MSIAAPINASARIRRLASENKLSPVDIAKLTGYDMKLIRAALGRGDRDKPKSKVPTIEARGPLTPLQLADRLARHGIAPVPAQRR